MWVHDGVSIIEDDYELCARVENHAELYYIPKEAYVGVSAATGGLSDDHDVISFLTYSVLTQEERAVKVKYLSLPPSMYGGLTLQ